MYKPLLLTITTASLAALVACDTGSCDSGYCGDSGFVIVDDGVTALTSVQWNCDGVGYFFTIGYSGWSASADLWFSQTTESAWSEIHTVYPSTEDANGNSSEYYFELDSVYDQGVNSVNEGVTTFFDCDQHRNTEVFQFDLYNEYNDAIADCALFGDVNGTVGANGTGVVGSGWSGACNNVW